MSGRPITVVASLLMIAFMILAIPTSTGSQLTTSALVEQANPEIADWPPPTSGNWVIDDITVVTSETFEMIGQRIIIEKGGALVLIGCAVTMTSTTQEFPNCYFEVQEGGNLTLRSTTITAGSVYRWLLTGMKGSIVDITDSTLGSHWGGPWATPWPIVEVEEGEYTRIVGSTISDSEGTGVGVSSKAAIIVDNSITRTAGTGLIVSLSPKANITGNTISNCGLADPSRPSGHGLQIRDCPEANVSCNAVSNVAQFGYLYVVSLRENALAGFHANTLDGLPVLLLENNDDAQAGPGYAQILISNSTNVEINGFDGKGIVACFADGLTVAESRTSHGGLFVSDSKNVMLIDNNVSDTKAWPYSAGSVVLGTCENCTVKGNRVTNGGPGSIGIVAYSSPSIKILENIIESTGEWGIALNGGCDDSYVTGNHISDTAWDGIRLTRSSNVVISYNTVNRTTAALSNFFAVSEAHGVGHGGVYVQEAGNTLVTHNTITNLIGDAIFAYLSPDTTISGNTVSNVLARGIEVEDCGPISVTDNIVHNVTWMAVGLDGCSSVRLVNNTVSQVAGLGFGWSNTVPTSKFNEYGDNSLDGRPVGIYQDEDHILGGSGLAAAIAINCTDAVFDNMEGNGLVACYSPRLVARNLVIVGGGVTLTHCENSTIAGCEIHDTPYLNMSFAWGSLGWGLFGVDLRVSSGSKLVSNYINNAGFPGINAYYSNMLILACNNITHSNTLGLQVVSCSEMIVTANVFNQSSSEFIRYVNSGKAKTYLNVFGESVEPPIAIHNSVTLQWDNGTHGNYWHDYAGVDSNGDGIGDTPYVISGSSIDQYPLMGTAPVQEHGRDLIGGPEVTDFSFLPPSPSTLDNVTIEVTASAFSGIDSVILSYSVDGGTTWSNVTMSQAAGVWSATLPRLPAGEVIFFATAKDNLGTTATYDLGRLEVAQAIDLVMPLVISGVGIAVVIGLAFVLHRRR